MDSILIYPDPPPAELAQTLDMSGYAWTAVDSASSAGRDGPDGGWSGAVVVMDDNTEGALSFCRNLRRDDATPGPIMMLVSGRALAELEGHSDLFDEFCVSPFHPREFEARLSHMLARAGVSASPPDLVEYGPLVLNTETYQAAVDQAPLDLTYMEYELLKFLASHPGKVFTRETLLSRVWGYDYFGGARTVDVHVRRLRAKLGDEHAKLIATVRSVGYSFGESPWSP